MRNIFVKLGVSSRVEVAARRARRASTASTRDAPRLTPTPRGSRELGYRQELDRAPADLRQRRARASPAISPVVGLYAVVLVGTLVAGPAWVWVLPVALAGQCLLLAVYAELASEFPIAGGAYQWSRRLIGGSYGWFTRLGRDLRLRGGQHDDRLPRRAVGADAARDRGRRRTRSSSPGMVLVRGLRARRRARRRGPEPRGQGRDRGRGRRLGRHRPRAAARLPRRRTSRSSPTRSAPRRSPAARSRRRAARGARGRRLGLHRLRRAASAPPRRRATPRGTCRGRSGSRCSASARS